MNALVEKYIDRVCGDGKVFKNGMVDYFRKDIFEVVELDDDSLYAIHKSPMETAFCFSYDEVMDCHSGTNTYQDACDMASGVGYDYFLDENTTDIKRKIDMFKGDQPVYVDIQYWRGPSNVVCFSVEKDNNTIREATDSEKKKVVDALERQLANKTKRCATYWKKYGKSKLHTWTYSCWD